ncbi:MAG TPA: hypothetical protein DEB24_01970 [Coriobacteriia bacterium]|nr:hypothetical protein [Coriobacteriia bacterium]
MPAHKKAVISIFSLLKTLARRPEFAPKTVPSDAMALPHVSTTNALLLFFVASTTRTKYMSISKKPVPALRSVLPISLFRAAGIIKAKNPATLKSMDILNSTSGTSALLRTKALMAI